MRERFIAWFEIAHPGMDPCGPTGRDEWLTWAQGYTAGMERTIEIYEGKVPGSQYTPDTDAENAAKPEVRTLRG